MKITGNEKVYPQQSSSAPGGLSIKQYFASQAMLGMLSGHELQLSKEEADVVAMQSVQFADSLINELNKEYL